MNRRIQRLVGQVILLPFLYLASLPDQAAFANLVSLALLIILTVNVTVAVILEWTHRQDQTIESLTEAADNAWTRVLIALGAAGAGVISLAFNVLGVTIPGRPFVAVLAWILLLNAVPALGWATRWRDEWLPAVRGKLSRSPADGDGDTSGGERSEPDESV